MASLSRYLLLLVTWAVIVLNLTISVAADLQQDLDFAQSNWYFSSNEGNYDFEYSEALNGDLDYPWIVKVRNNSVNQTTTASGGDPPNTPPTIEELFDTIQEAINNDTPSLDATFNETYGYPTNIYIDNAFDISISNAEKQPFYDVIAMQARLTAARNLWDSTLIPAYIFNFRRGCFGCDYFSDYPWSIQVAEGSPGRAIDANGSIVEDLRIASIPDLFDTIQGHIDEKAFNIGVEYSGTLGYPRNFWVDQDPRIADEEYGITIDSMGVFGNPAAAVSLAKELWQMSDIDSYSYRLNKPNGDPQLAYPWTIEVREGLGVSITDANGVVIENTGGNFPLMETHFAAIEDGLNSNADVKTTYSRTHGFPRQYSIHAGAGAVDRAEITRFQRFEATQ